MKINNDVRLLPYKKKWKNFNSQTQSTVGTGVDDYNFDISDFNKMISEMEHINHIIFLINLLVTSKNGISNICGITKNSSKRDSKKLLITFRLH